MHIKHHEKGFNYSSRELLTIARKLGKLATYCTRVKDEGSYISINAEHRKTEKQRDAMKVSMTIKLPKKVLRAESRRPDVLEAVDRCVEKLQPQVEKYKELHLQKGRVQKHRRKY